MTEQLALFTLPRSRRNDPRCLDCDVDTLEIGHFYMLRDDVWLEANPTVDGMLCIDCLETRLGRRLAPTDFSDAPCNHWPLLRLSERDGVEMASE
jgi:hypothetical protein